jgi:putative hemin transport protein
MSAGVRDAVAVRAAFAQARQRGLRAREAAHAIGLSEGAVMAAHVGLHEHALRAVPLKSDWLALLQSLQACGPLMALTRNEGTVHEKTGVYINVSAQGRVGLALGEDIDLRLFFNRWHAGFVVSEAHEGAYGPMQASLQFYDRSGTAVHKIFPRSRTEPMAWERLLNTWIEPAREAVFGCSSPALQDDPDPVVSVDVASFLREWSAMTDTHQFFGLLGRHGLQRQQAFALAQGRFTHPVARSAVRQLLQGAAIDGTPIMVFVGSPGCIQIHTGPVQRVEPLEMRGRLWLNVLDPGFNLHLREDLIASVWVVEKPGDHGNVTSLEAFDARGELMAMFFGARKPGQPERQGWRDLLAPLREAGQQAVVA